MPAVNPRYLRIRVGGNAQIKAMKKVAGTLSWFYSQYESYSPSHSSVPTFGQDTKQRLAQGERIVEVLKQGKESLLPLRSR